MPTDFYGVDVAKAALVIARKGESGSHAIANEATAITRWLQGLPAGSAVAMESTGRYHHVLAEQARAQGFLTYVLNAKDVCFYAKALGGRSKTDRADAHVIARFIAEHHETLHPWQPAAPSVGEVWELTLRRAELVKLRGSIRQSMQDTVSLAPAVASLDQAFEDLLRALDERMAALQRQDRELGETTARLQTIKGVGPQGGAMLAALFRRIPFRSADALVAYSGLDPRAHDSGQKRGRRRLSKRGPPPLRRQAYLMAKAAIKSPLFKPMYQALKARGLATTQALVIMARKLLRVAFAVWKTKTPFDEARFAVGST